MQGDEFPRLRPLQACGRSQGHHSSDKLCEQGLCDASESHLAVVLAPPPHRTHLQGLCVRVRARNCFVRWPFEASHSHCRQPRPTGSACPPPPSSSAVASCRENHETSNGPCAGVRVCLVLLVLRHQVVHVRLCLGKLHLIHASTGDGMCSTFVVRSGCPSTQNARSLHRCTNARRLCGGTSP